MRRGRGTGWRSATLLQAPERSHLSLRLSPHKKMVPFQRRQSEGHQDVAAAPWDGGEGVVGGGLGGGGGGWGGGERITPFLASISRRSCSPQSLLRLRTHGRYHSAEASAHYSFLFLLADGNQVCAQGSPGVSSFTADGSFFFFFQMPFKQSLLLKLLVEEESVLRG